MTTKPLLGTRKNIPSTGFKRFTFREQIEIIHLYLKKHPEGSIVSDMIKDLHSSRKTIKDRINQMKRLGFLYSRGLGGNNLRLYYYVENELPPYSNYHKPPKKEN